MSRKRRIHSRRGNYKLMLRHKDYLKDQHARIWGKSSWEAMVLEYEGGEPTKRNRALKYWKNFEKSTYKKFAKHMAARRLRIHMNDALHNAGNFTDEHPTMHGARYRRLFDYKRMVY